jgi:putative ABC transport system substrate-binding protein
MVGVADPVGNGLIESLSRPGGNVTGTSSVAADLVGKQIELLKEVLPPASRIAALSAKLLDIVIPSSILVRAEEVIE